MSKLSLSSRFASASAQVLAPSGAAPREDNATGKIDDRLRHDVASSSEWSTESRSSPESSLRHVQSPGNPLKYTHDITDPSNPDIARGNLSRSPDGAGPDDPLDVADLGEQKPHSNIEFNGMLENAEEMRSVNDQEQWSLLSNEEAPRRPLSLHGSKEGFRKGLVETLSCGVCHEDLSSWHYLERIRHVKRCVSRQPRRTEIHQGVDACVPIPGNALPPGPGGLLQMDIKEWLKGLDLEGYADTFVAEEVDMSIVHALDDKDLTALGIRDRLLQLRFQHAARQVGAEIAAAKRKESHHIGDKSAGGNAPKKTSESNIRAAPSKLVQRTLLGVGKQAQREKAVKLPTVKRNTAASKSNVEAVLLSHLYPEDCDVDGVLPTPPLFPSDALATARIHDARDSLFTCAARCEQVTTSMEIRLEKRRAERKKAGVAADPEPLARGGVRYTLVDEGRAVKLLKLKSLEEELECHESTVQELRRLVKELKDELGVQ